MNILTFDIEEWALAKAGGYGGAEKYALYDSYLDKILDALDVNGIKATFFCTGAMADEFPKVVRLIHSRGHEIGCHSYRHTWMNKLTETEAREDTHKAVNALEQCVGEKILSYRAPAFSIGESNKWMFEILAENRITRDASIFPAERDFGGFPKFGQKEPCVVQYKGVNIKEFPICTARLLGKEVAYSGGGYFRLFPLSFVKNEMRKRAYAMLYFHIGDLIPEIGGMMSRKDYETYFKEPGTFKARFVRYIKSNIGKRPAFNKLNDVLNSTVFQCMRDADTSIKWTSSIVRI